VESDENREAARQAGKADEHAEADIRRRIAPALLKWYDRHARRLPWRDYPTPYRVWISEIMLQQTRVETVLPYFERWMERFPTLEDLAAASEQEVLQVWEGLGYYSRARNLHKAARQVMAEYGGQIPSERDQLERLSGIGRYTAGAIASIAFGKDEPALDANIRRVLARVFNVSIPARSPEGERLLWQLARETLPQGQNGSGGRAGDYNQALMDLGASICLPHAPTCLLCPLAEFCAAHAAGLEEQRPVLEAKPPVPHYLVTAAVIQRDEQVLIARRPSSGLLGGLWEFPGGKVEAGESLPEGLRREIMEELGVAVAVGEPYGVYRHAYTHFKVTLHAFACRLLDGEPRALQASEIRWVQPGELGEFPMGKIDRQIARFIGQDQS
jgi:A/G-specific adenine glycosylase